MWISQYGGLEYGFGAEVRWRCFLGSSVWRHLIPLELVSPTTWVYELSLESERRTALSDSPSWAP